MSELDESLEQRFARLSADTENLKPRSDFTRRVMSSVGQVRRSTVASDWVGQVMVMARIGVTVAAMAAVAVFAVAWERSHAADEEEALSYGVAEVFE